MVSEVFLNNHKDLLSIMEELIEVGKKVVDRGLAVGSGGNLSFRAQVLKPFLLLAQAHN